MRKVVVIALLFASLQLLADEPRIHRVSERVKENARATLAGAIRDGAIRDGSIFAPLVQCGPRLWARIHDRFEIGDDGVLRTTLMFDGAERARAWGFLHESDVESGDRRKVIDAMAAAESRVAIQTAAFRRGGEKRLGPHVAQFLAAPIVPVVRDATNDELWYQWLLVPFDLEEPIFVIEVGATKLLVNLDENQKITWVDLIPES